VYAVGGRQQSKAAVAIGLALLALLTAAPAQATFLGSNLAAAPDTGVCRTSGTTPEASCTESQLQLLDGHTANGGLISEHHGVVTRWLIASGVASPATARVQLRLRVLRGGVPNEGGSDPYVDLPLTEPGIHRFPARLPIERDGELGLDVAVLGSGGGVGSAPIAHTEPGLGEMAEWEPPLMTSVRPITTYLQDTELLLGARVEPDQDRDNYGDRTQDRCSYDPRRHSPCLPDRVRPQIQVRYATRQNFLASREVLLKVRPSEFSEVFASGQLEVPTTTWGIFGAGAWVHHGGSAKLLHLRIPPRALAAGKAARERGARVYVKSFITVVDAAGNRTHKTVRVFPG
jgi:hypothetical protein